MSMKTWVVLGLSVAGLSACPEPQAARCTPQSCASGCCLPGGVCAAGNVASACGINGAACAACSGGNVCRDNECRAPAAGGSAAGGSAAGGSAAGGSAAGGSATGGGGGTSWDGGTPAWRQTLAKWQWFELQGTSLANQPVTNPFNGAMERPRARIDAWNGLAANTADNRVFLAAAGGHADWAGNEVYAIDLSAPTPSWSILRGPSAGSTIVTNQAYYTDGRPSSTHLYYALHFVRARNRIFKMSAGSVWGDGNGNNNKVDAFDLATGDWDPMGTWAEASTSGSAIDRPYAQHATTEDIYTFMAGQFRRWNAATATWQSLAPRPSYANDDIVNASASGVDPVRGRVVFLRNLYRVAQRQGLQLTLTGTLTDVTFTGPSAGIVTQGQQGMQFVPSEDVFLIKTSTGGEVIRLDASNVLAPQVTSGPTPPNAVNGVYTRWLYLPRLGGVAYLPHGNANFWFLATE